MSTTERYDAEVPGALPQLLDELRRRGIAVRAEGGQLRVEASGGVATPEIMAALRAHKSELLEWLSQLAVDDPAAAGELPPLVRRPDERHEPFELTDLQQAYW
ncbi:MAG: hypothetical protein QOH83_1605, partial [Solirubrobacteraceae bacterium]|nr:hypothetical protein [Solirubrobacteraceae bacterium]